MADAAGGAAVNKTVGVHVKATSDLASLDAVIAKLREIQQAASSVAGPINITNSFNGASAAASRAAADMKALTTETQAATAAQRELNAATGQLSVLGQNMREVKRVTSQTAAGDTSTVTHYTNEAATLTQARSSTGAKRTTEISPQQIRADEERRGAIMANMAEQRLRREEQMREASAGRSAARDIDIMQRKWNTESAMAAREAQAQEARAGQSAAREINIMQSKWRAEEAAAAKTADIQTKLSANTAKLQNISQATGLPITQNIANPQQLEVLNAQGVALAKLNQQTGAMTVNMQSLTRATAGFGGEMLNVIGKVALWSVATGAIFGTIHAVKEAIATYAAFELQTIMLARVGQGLGATQAEIGAASQALTRDILDLKVAYGSVGTGALQAATVFARLGYTAEETKKAVEQTLMLANLTGVAPERVGADIEAIILQFRMEASAIADVAEKLYAVDKAGRVTTEDLLQGASRVGAAWRESGGTFEELNAVIGALVQATGRHGGELANAVKFITSREANMELMRKIYDMTGVDVHGKNPIQFWDEVAAAMAKMDPEHRKQVLTTLAGNRQWSVAATLLDNLALVHKNVAVQMGATGQAMRDNEAVIDSLTKRWDALKAAAERYANTVVAPAAPKADPTPRNRKPGEMLGGPRPVDLQSFGQQLKLLTAMAESALAAAEALEHLRKTGNMDWKGLDTAGDHFLSAMGLTRNVLVGVRMELEKTLELMKTQGNMGTGLLQFLIDMLPKPKRGGGVQELPPGTKLTDLWRNELPGMPPIQSKADKTEAEDFAAMDRVERAIEEIGLAYERTRELAQAYGASAAETAETVARSHYEQAAALRDAASAAREAGRTDEAKKYEEAEKKETDAGRKGDIRAEREAEKEAINKVIKLRKESIEDAITEARAAADTGPAWERGLKQAQAEAEVLRRKLADAHTEEKTWTDAVSSMKEGGLAKEAAEAEAKRAAAVQIRKGLEDQLHAAARAQRREEAESIRKKDEHLKREAQHVANMLLQMSTPDLLKLAIRQGEEARGEVTRPKSLVELAGAGEEWRRVTSNQIRLGGDESPMAQAMRELAENARTSGTKSITNDVMTTRAHEVGHATVGSMSIGTITMNGMTVSSEGQTGWPTGLGEPPSQRSNLWYTPQFLIPPPGPQEPAVRPPAPPAPPAPDRTPIGEARGGGTGATVPAEGANFTVNITMGGLVADGDKLATQVALLVSNAVDGVADKLIARVNAGAAQTALKGGQSSARIA